MSLHDKQITWEELHNFPNQVLARDQSEKILANIREERRKMLKQQKRGKYVGWMASGLVTCALLFAFIWMKPFSFPAETAGSTSSVDTKISTAAQKAIEATGITKKFHFEETEQETDYLIVRTKDRESIVTFKPNSLEVRTVYAMVSVNELPDMYKKYVETARAAFQVAKQDVHFEQGHLFQDKEKTTLSFYLENTKAGKQQYAQVDVKTNKVSAFLIEYKPDDVDQKYVSIAEKAFMHISNNKRFSFTEASKSSDKKEEMWKLTNTQDRYSVQVGARTGKVYHIGYVTDYRIKSINEVVSVAKPLIQSIFGLDVTGYTAYGGRDWGGYVLKHEGKPDVTVFIANFDIGNISGISVKW